MTHTMSKQQEALRLALEALENTTPTGFNMERDKQFFVAITAIKEALAQPDYRAIKTYHEGKPVYVAQPEQEPVAWVCYGAPGKRDIDFEEADINGLPIGTSLYTSPQHPQQEQNLNCKSTQARLATAWGYVKVLDISDKRLMEMPPQREWAGLTDEEALDCWPGLAMYADCVKFWENIEAKLKEKNGAHIHRNGKQVYLGLFATAEMAHQAYKENQ